MDKNLFVMLMKPDFSTVSSVVLTRPRRVLRNPCVSGKKSLLSPSLQGIFSGSVPESGTGGVSTLVSGTAPVDLWLAGGTGGGVPG